MSSTVFSTKQIKVFNKIHQEFLDEYNKTLNKESTVYKIKKGAILVNFLDDVEKVIESYMNREVKCLKSIRLFCDNGVSSSIKNEEEANKIINWEYLHSMLFIVMKKEKALEFCIPKKDVAHVDDTFSQIIASLSKDIKDSLEGKDLSKINPAELMSGLLNGNGNTVVGGIDFGEIISKTTKTLKHKVDSGDISLESLKENAKSIAGHLNTNIDVD
jgi:hypothetical protein